MISLLQRQSELYPLRLRIPKYGALGLGVLEYKEYISLFKQEY